MSRIRPRIALALARAEQRRWDRDRRRRIQRCQQRQPEHELYWVNAMLRQLEEIEGLPTTTSAGRG